MRSTVDVGKVGLTNLRVYARRDTTRETTVLAGRTAVCVPLFEARRGAILAQERGGARLPQLLDRLLDVDSPAQTTSVPNARSFAPVLSTVLAELSQRRVSTEARQRRQLPGSADAGREDGRREASEGERTAPG